MTPTLDQLKAFRDLYPNLPKPQVKRFNNRKTAKGAFKIFTDNPSWFFFYHPSHLHVRLIWLMERLLELELKDEVRATVERILRENNYAAGNAELSAWERALIEPWAIVPFAISAGVSTNDIIEFLLALKPDQV